jgi:hypothetical protein
MEWSKQEIRNYEDRPLNIGSGNCMITKILTWSNIKPEKEEKVREEAGKLQKSVCYW